MNDNCDANEWKQVFSRKSKSRKPTTLGRINQSGACTKSLTNIDDDWDVLMKKFAHYRLELANTKDGRRFVNGLIDAINSALGVICPSVNAPISVLCLGLGNPASNRSSLRQLALLDLLVELHDRLDRSNVYLYDPMFGSVSRCLIKHLQMQIFTSNKEGAYALDSSCYYFIMLPHCPPAILNNLLQANWNAQVICRMILYTSDWSCFKREWNADDLEQMQCIVSLESTLIGPAAQLYLSRSTRKQSWKEVPDFENMRIQYFDPAHVAILPQLIWQTHHTTVSQYNLIGKSEVAHFVDQE